MRVQRIKRFEPDYGPNQGVAFQATVGGNMTYLYFSDDTDIFLNGDRVFEEDVELSIGHATALKLEAFATALLKQPELLDDHMLPFLKGVANA